MKFIKTTIVGGIIFMVPIIIIILIMSKAYELMVLVVAPIDRLIPMELFEHVPFSRLFALFSILVICFLAGLFARSSVAKKFYRSVDNGLLVVPGYAFIKAYTDSMRIDQAEASNIEPILVRLDDYSQIGFEIERLDNGLVVVYLPGAPDPWSGTVGYFNADRVTGLDMSVTQAMNNIRRLGRGSVAFHSAFAHL